MEKTCIHSLQTNIFPFKTTEMSSDYLQQLVSEVGLNQPVVQCDVEELVLGPLGQTEDLFKLMQTQRQSALD